MAFETNSRPKYDENDVRMPDEPVFFVEPFHSIDAADAAAVEAADVTAVVDEIDTDEPPTLLKCPQCGYSHVTGELICVNCQHVFAAGGKTQRFDLREVNSIMKGWPTGDGITTEQRPIVFEIGGHSLTLPIAEVITAGRRGAKPTDVYPHVDLSGFGAEEQGVSRDHIRIRRKGILVYVADLKSTNGTHLNGRRLLENGERLLRDGDELHLSRLRIRVRF